MKQKYNRRKQLNKTKKGGMGCSRKKGNKYKSYRNSTNRRMKRRNSISRRKRIRNNIRNITRIMGGGSNSCSNFNTNKEVLDITSGGGTMWDGGNPYTWGKTGQYYGLERHFDRFDKAFNI